MAELLIDARYLEPPEPFVKAMEALDHFAGLAAGAPESIRLLLFREPFPLYKVLQDNGFVWNTTQAADGTFAIVIRPRSES